MKNVVPISGGSTAMTAKDLETLYEYGYWANRRLFSVIAQLTPEQFTHSVGGSYGSIRNTLVHIMSAEWGWLGRCGGPPRGARLEAANYPTLESVLETWNKVERYMREFLDGIKDEDLTRQAEYVGNEGEMRSMPLGELLQHAANHGVHHRGQIAMMLRMLGHAPGDVDILIYYAEKRGVPAF